MSKIFFEYITGAIPGAMAYTPIIIIIVTLMKPWRLLKAEQPYYSAENGKQIVLHKGDVIVIPAGVAHKNLGRLKDVICIGGYPEGRDFDMNYGNPEERPKADKNIESLPLPVTGPLEGNADPLVRIWKQENHAAPKQIEVANVS